MNVHSFITRRYTGCFTNERKKIAIKRVVFMIEIWFEHHYEAN